MVYKLVKEIHTNSNKLSIPYTQLPLPCSILTNHNVCRFGITPISYHDGSFVDFHHPNACINLQAKTKMWDPFETLQTRFAQLASFKEYRIIVRYC